jgi:hypothetical protein
MNFKDSVGAIALSVSIFSILFVFYKHCEMWDGCIFSKYIERRNNRIIPVLNLESDVIYITNLHNNKNKKKINNKRKIIIINPNNKIDIGIEN